jgi:HSP90 family molecular chaperone
VNPNHPIIVKLNELRKREPKRASLIAHQIMDNAMLSSNIPFNINDSVQRNFQLMNDFLNAAANNKLLQ